MKYLLSSLLCFSLTTPVIAAVTKSKTDVELQSFFDRMIEEQEQEVKKLKELRAELASSTRQQEENFSSKLQSMKTQLKDDFDKFTTYARGGNVVTREGISIKDKNTAYDIDASMPGMNKENVKVSVNGNEVIIAGTTRNELHKTEGGIQRDEVSVGNFTRSVMLKDSVDPKSLKVSFDKDMVHINVNKTKI